jgi:hypothetical protein
MREKQSVSNNLQAKKTLTRRRSIKLIHVVTYQGPDGIDNPVVAQYCPAGQMVGNDNPVAPQ